MNGMNRIFQAVTISLSLLLFVPVGYAQDQPQFRFHLPCGEVIRMGLGKYFTRYTAATHDQSTAGCIEAYESYAHCRRSVNDTLAHTLSHARQDQIIQVRRALDTLAEACYDYTYLSAGGGTMWSEMEADDHAGREDFLAALIADLRRPVRSSRTARRQAESVLRAARRSLDTLRTPLAEGASTMQASYTTQYRSQTYPSALIAFAHLQTLTAALPDAAAHRLAQEIQQELATPAKNVN
jgi:hypothetical protein